VVGSFELLEFFLLFFKFHSLPYYTSKKLEKVYENLMFISTVTSNIDMIFKNKKRKENMISSVQFF